MVMFVFESAEKAQLCLFGSSKNGFGFRDSDLDICMTLEGHETAEVKADFTPVMVSEAHRYHDVFFFFFLNN